MFGMSLQEGTSLIVSCATNHKLHNFLGYTVFPPDIKFQSLNFRSTLKKGCHGVFTSPKTFLIGRLRAILIGPFGPYNTILTT